MFFSTLGGSAFIAVVIVAANFMIFDGRHGIAVGVVGCLAFLWSAILFYKYVRPFRRRKKTVKIIIEKQKSKRRGYVPSLLLALFAVKVLTRVKISSTIILLTCQQKGYAYGQIQ